MRETKREATQEEILQAARLPDGYCVGSYVQAGCQKC
jgi:hypothetical protein